MQLIIIIHNDDDNYHHHHHFINLLAMKNINVRKMKK